MSTPFAEVTFLARTGKALEGISGADITLPASTTAQGLYKVGNIDIDANGAGATTVDVHNSGLGVANLNVDGNVDAGGSVRGNALISLNTVRVAGGTAFVIDLTGAPTADRVQTLPDHAGNVVVTSTTAVNTGRIMVSGNLHLQDNGSTQAIQLTGAPTGNRTQTFPDYNGDILSRNSASGVIDLNAYAIATFQLTRNGANCTFAFENAGADKANITSTGAMAQWGATPAASQPGAIADLTVTPVIVGADTVDALTLLMALNTLQSDMNSILAALRSAGVIAT